MILPLAGSSAIMVIIDLLYRVCHGNPVPNQSIEQSEATRLLVLWRGHGWLERAVNLRQRSDSGLGPLFPSLSIAQLHHRFNAGLCCASETVKSVVLNVAGDEHAILWTCSAPDGDPGNSDLFPRYVAASLNNIVMTHGAHSWIIEADRNLGEEIEAILACDFRQSLEIIRIRCSSSEHSACCYPDIAKDGDHDHMEGGPPPRDSESHWRLGIDIGNSKTKIAILAGGTPVDLYEEPTNLQCAASGPLEYFNKLAKLIRNLETSLPAPFKRFTSIGVAWFGDVYKGGLLTQAADLAPWSTGPWREELNIAPQFLASQGLSIRFLGDSEALGRYIGARREFYRSYLLILGTSTGGACFSGSGRYLEGANLVSRLVIDLSGDAPQHTATKAPGVLQQFSGSYGLRRALIATSPRERKNFRLQANDAYSRLEYLLVSHQPGERAWGEAAITLLADWLSIAVRDLRTHYELEALLLSGGISRGLVGDSLVAALNLSLNSSEARPLRVRRLTDVTKWPSTHEVAVAAALMAQTPYLIASVESHD